MEQPIHAGKNVDKDETVPRLVALAAGVVIIAIIAGVVVFSGIWNPPSASKAAAPQTQSQGVSH